MPSARKMPLFAMKRARLAYAFNRDCEESVALYDESATVDPHYLETRFERAEIYIACAASASDDKQEEYYRSAIDSLREGIELPLIRGSRSKVQRWFQLAQIHQQLGEYDEALEAYEQARELADGRFPAWQTEIQMATIHQQLSEIDRAINLVEQALANVPENHQDRGQIVQYLAELRGEPIAVPRQPI